MKENNTGIKAILAASNEPCWEITSGTCVVKKGNKFRCYVRARKHPNSARGDKNTASVIHPNLQLRLSHAALGLV